MYIQDDRMMMGNDDDAENPDWELRRKYVLEERKNIFFDFFQFTQSRLSSTKSGRGKTVPDRQAEV